MIVLPSGRPLFYQNARLVDDQYGKKIVYDGVDQKTRRWGRQSTYGGKIVENCTQAIARDCLAVSMLRLDDAGYKIVMCVHDENIEDSDVGSIEEMNTIMGSPIDWAPGLPLAAAGYITKFYLKED